MTNDYSDEWETGSGLALDGSIATIIDMEFGFNAQIGSGITTANLTLQTDDGEEIEQSFSTGGQNEPSRDGKILEGSGKINKRSNFGMLIESIKEVVDNPAETIGRVRDVSGWIGTKWAWGTVDVETTNPRTGETKTSSKFIVVDYLGREGEGSKGSKGGAKSKGSSKKAAKKVDEADAEDDSSLWNDLVTLAGQYDDHDDFVDAAFATDGVSDDRELQKAVMKTGAGSVWDAAGKS